MKVHYSKNNSLFHSIQVMRKFLSLVLLCSASATITFGQTDSLMDMLNSGPATKTPVSATFKATRIINGSSVENLGAGVLDFRIAHRFGQINQGAENFFGLDNAVTRLGLDYGITSWLMVGIGHSTLNKTNDGFAKVKLLKQKIGGTPVTLSYLGNIGVVSGTVASLAPSLPAGDKYYFSNRLTYTNQLLVARKFNDWLSLQIMPTIVHQNLVDSTKFSNNTLICGVGGRIKLNKRIAITGEYYYRFNNTDMLAGGQKTYNALSVGVDIETGGHVFQFMLTNSQALSERSFLNQTTDSWDKGALHFGFNISRVFTIVKPKEFRSAESKGW